MFEDDSNTKYVTTFLKRDAIRWINKRQSNNSNSDKAYLFPPLSLQLYEMLNKEEYEFPGNRKIAELRSAVTCVVELYNLLESAKSDTHEVDFINGYVGSDRSGGIEFAEYLALNYERYLANRFAASGSSSSGSSKKAPATKGTTSSGVDESTTEEAAKLFDYDDDYVDMTGDVQEFSMRKARLHAAFDELCSFMRRRRIDQRLSDSSATDVEKYNSMVELFGINYFKTNGFEKKITKQNFERSRRFPGMQVQKSGMRNYKLETTIELRKQRSVEMKRVRDAALYLDAKHSDPKEQEEILKFWEGKGDILPLRKLIHPPPPVVSLVAKQSTSTSSRTSR
jgi:hypothetical protein